MKRGRTVLVTLAASCLVAACSSGGSEGALDPSGRPTTSLDAGSDSSATGLTTSADRSTTTPAPPTTVVPTTLLPTPPAPTAAPPPPAVATTPQSAAPRVKCEGAAAEPPAGVTGVQATYADIDADTRADVVWLYNAADGTHLHIRTGRGVADDIVLPFGQGAVAVGIAQVDLAVGTANPGTAQEIVAVTSDGDGRRLVGVYGFAINTGCIETFVFDQGNPFVYLVSKNGNLSGLVCVSDGVTGHLEALTATPAAGDAFTTSRLVFGRVGRRLVPVSYESGSLPAPADAGVLATDSDITGCSLSSPAF